MGGISGSDDVDRAEAATAFGAKVLLLIAETREWISIGVGFSKEIAAASLSGRAFLRGRPRPRFTGWPEKLIGQTQENTREHYKLEDIF